MNISESFAFVSFTLFSFSDLRYRLVPGIELFFLGAVMLGFSISPMHVLIILCASIWGLLPNIPGSFILPMFFHPPTWPVLLTGYGYRKGIIGRADLLAIGGLACLLPLPAVLFSLVGVEVWRRIWTRKNCGPIPILPGMLMGISLFLLLRI